MIRSGAKGNNMSDAIEPNYVAKADLNAENLKLLSASVPITTLRWWKELATLNPNDLPHRIEAYLPKGE